MTLPLEIARRFFIGFFGGVLKKCGYKMVTSQKNRPKRKWPASLQALFYLVARGGIEPPTQGFSSLFIVFHNQVDSWMDFYNR